MVPSRGLWARACSRGWQQVKRADTWQALLHWSSLLAAPGHPGSHQPGSRPWPACRWVTEHSGNRPSRPAIANKAIINQPVTADPPAKPTWDQPGPAGARRIIWLSPTPMTHLQTRELNKQWLFEDTTSGITCQAAKANGYEGSPITLKSFTHTLYYILRNLQRS